MMPVIFRIPLVNWNIPGYGLMLMFAFLLAVIWAARRAARSGANPDVVLNCAFIILIGGVVGSRFMYVVHYWDQFAYRGNLGGVIWAILDMRKGGLVVYGGVILAAVGVMVYMVFWRHSLRWYLDIIAPSAALGMGLGRIGCFLNGCCWGGVSDLPWAVRFPFGSSPAAEQWYAGEPGVDLPQELIYFPPSGIGTDGRAAYVLDRELLWVRDEQIARELADAQESAEQTNSLRSRLAEAQSEAEKRALGNELARVQRAGASRLRHADIVLALATHGLTLPELRELARPFRSQPVHPAQLYSTITLVLIALLLGALYWRRRRDGQVFCMLLFLEPWTRFVLEILRADEGPLWGPFTLAQLTAPPISLVGLAGLIALRYLPPRSPRARLWEPPPEEAAPPKKQARAAKPAK